MKSDNAALNSSLGKNIRLFRKMRGYSQEYLALMTGINQSNINRLESGQVEVKLSALIKICSILNISIFLLLFMSDQKGVFTNSQGGLQGIRQILLELLNSTQLDETIRKELVEALSDKSD